MQIGVMESLKNIFANGSSKRKKIKKPKWADIFSSYTTLREELDTTEWLHFHCSLSCMEKEMATHSSVLAWRIPGTEKPGGLLSKGSHRVRHDWSDLAVAAAAAYSITFTLYWYFYLREKGKAIENENINDGFIT